MKTRKLFIAMALPALLAACSQDEFVNENKFAEVPQLADGFKLNAEKVMGTQTKGTWVEEGTGADTKYVYKWEVKTTEAISSEILGLCWTGKVGDTNYTDQAAKNLFTNYKFDISKGADDVNEDGTLKNAINAGVSQSNAEYKKYAEFTTGASSLFAGEYIVYYPYNPSFNNVGYIKATVGSVFDAGNAATKADMYKVGGPKMFMMSDRTAMSAGQTSENFKLSAKSTLLRIDLWMAAGETPAKVDKIILFDNTGLASEMKYNADGSVVENSVVYGYKTITGKYKGIDVAATTKETAIPFVLPMLNVDLKSTTVMYIHDATTKKWAKKAFLRGYSMKAGVMPIELKEGLKANEFNLDLVTDADELKAAIEADANSIDILTDITLDNTFTSTWNVNEDVTITSASGAKLIFDVKDGGVSFGKGGAGAKAINFDCDVEVKNSGTTASNIFTLACGSTISGTFTNNIVSATFAENVTIAEEGKVVNSGTLKLTAAKTLTVLGDVTNNEEATIEIVANAALNVSGRNAQVTNNGNLDNSGTMTITKYTGNSVVNNGVAIVNETGTFEGDFDTTSTGVFWKKAADIADLKDALTKSYSKIILSGTGSNAFNFSTATDATVLEAGNKDIEFASTAITMPSTAGQKNFTLNTTGTVTIKQVVTLGMNSTDATAPVVTIKAGAVKAEAGLTVEKTGILTVTGDIDATNAAVAFKNGSTVSFANFNNNGGASLTLENGANVTYTGKINLIPAAN